MIEKYISAGNAHHEISPSFASDPRLVTLIPGHVNTFIFILKKNPWAHLSDQGHMTLTLRCRRAQGNRYAFSLLLSVPHHPYTV